MLSENSARLPEDTSGERYSNVVKKILQRFSAGETVYAAPSKKTSTGGGTLGRRTRRGHTSALSSSSTASDRSETVFPDEHTRMHLTNGKLQASPFPFHAPFFTASRCFVHFVRRIACCITAPTRIQPIRFIESIIVSIYRK